MARRPACLSFRRLVLPWQLRLQHSLVVLRTLTCLRLDASLVVVRQLSLASFVVLRQLRLRLQHGLVVRRKLATGLQLPRVAGERFIIGK